MTVSVQIAGVMGSFQRKDKRDDFHIGEYYRLPDGSIYFYHSKEPEHLFLLVLKNDIPKDTPIIDLERSKW